MAGTSDGSRRVARTVGDAGSRLRTRQSGSYWERSSAAVSGVVLREEGRPLGGTRIRFVCDGGSGGRSGRL